MHKLRIREVVHRAPLTVCGDGDGCGFGGLVCCWGDGEGYVSCGRGVNGCCCRIGELVAVLIGDGDCCVGTLALRAA